MSSADFRVMQTVTLSLVGNLRGLDRHSSQKDSKTFLLYGSQALISLSKNSGTKRRDELSSADDGRKGRKTARSAAIIILITNVCVKEPTSGSEGCASTRVVREKVMCENVEVAGSSLRGFPRNTPTVRLFGFALLCSASIFSTTSSHCTEVQWVRFPLLQCGCATRATFQSFLRKVRRRRHNAVQ